MQGNLAIAYGKVGRNEDAVNLYRDVYSGYLKLNGEEHEETLRTANNLADSLINLERFEEANSMMRKAVPVAQRVLGESRQLTLMMRWKYAATLCEADGATLGDLREAVNTLEETERIARRVLGGAHPTTRGIETVLQKTRVLQELKCCLANDLQRSAPADTPSASAV